MKKHKMKHLSPLLWPKMKIIKGYFSLYYLKNLIANLKKKLQGHSLSGSIFIVIKDIVKICPKSGYNKLTIYYTKWEK